MTTLRLGHVDEGREPTHLAEYLRAFHEGPKLLASPRWRDEPDGVFRSLEPLPGAEIASLQASLQGLGFYPTGDVDGVFGYRTRSAVRLFQHYVRFAEGDAAIGVPDGVAGPKTAAALARWRESGNRFDSLPGRGSLASDDFGDWLALLSKVRQAWQDKSDSPAQASHAFGGPTDTLRLSQWNTDPMSIHLLGIRRKAGQSSNKRSNDDAFVLLLGGRYVWKFTGSTDPNPSLAERKDEPYLVPGQHVYRFGWHKLGTDRVYRALKPAQSGPLVFRDRDDDDALSAADMLAGASANDSINIHWSGRGTSNWSAGCQVIAGKSYLDTTGRVVDCSPFASVTYGGLAGNAGTRGAYDVFVDAMSIVARSIRHRDSERIHYTLLREEDLALGPEKLAGAAAAIVNALA